MYITKVRITKKGVEIHYEECTANGASETQILKSSDKAKPSFYQALGNLKPHFLTLLDLPTEWGKGVVMVGLVATYQDGMEFSMIAEKSIVGFEKGVLLRTPKGMFTGEAKEAFERACAEAEAYVRGERAQQMIPFTPED